MKILEDVFETYSDKILQIFQFYCSYGEPMNTTKLKSSKFIKILKEINLISAAKGGNQQHHQQSFNDENVSNNYSKTQQIS